MTHDEMMAQIRALDDEQLYHFLSYLTALCDQPVTIIRSALSFARNGTEPAREPGTCP
jgi:hypothetical protein